MVQDRFDGEGLIIVGVMPAGSDSCVVEYSSPGGRAGGSGGDGGGGDAWKDNRCVAPVTRGNRKSAFGVGKGPLGVGVLSQPFLHKSGDNNHKFFTFMDTHKGDDVVVPAAGHLQGNVRTEGKEIGVVFAEVEYSADQVLFDRPVPPVCGEFLQVWGACPN